MHQLAALGDGTRRSVLEALRGGALTVGELAERLPVSRPAVSQHLRALQDAGWVVDRWEGTRHYFSINAATVLETRRYLESMWQDAMQAYAHHVSTEEKKRDRSPRNSDRRK
ncbi:MAG: metalloregulator ArsR/SmtB family transcription factor [Burkholderiales bacterium]|nr:metalloregulator ArsR/SmtB family transcription factor [Burkholderiales bacterium]